MFKKKFYEFEAFENSTKMFTEVSAVYGLQEAVFQFGDKPITGTNVYFSFGVMIFVNVEYETLKKEIFGV